MRRLSLSNKKKPLLILLCLVLVLVGLMAWTWNYVNSPAVGTVSIKRSDNPNVNDNTTQFATLANQYFSMLYPTYLDNDLAQSTPQNSLTYDYMTRRDSSRKVTDSIEVYLKNLPKGGITLDDDYRKYVSQPKKYKVINKYYGGELVNLAVSNKGSIERNAMWVHGEYLLIVKMMASDKDDVDVDLETVLKSVQWH